MEQESQPLIHQRNYNLHIHATNFNDGKLALQTIKQGFERD
jgi:hypothetical protein